MTDAGNDPRDAGRDAADCSAPGFDAGPTSGSIAGNDRNASAWNAGCSYAAGSIAHGNPVSTDDWNE